MNGYIACEDAVRARLLDKFSIYLDSENTLAGDVDSIIENMLVNNKRFGCYIDYSGAVEDLRKPFATPVWIWRIVGVFLIRLTDEYVIEDDLREILDTLALLFRPDHTLGGVTPMAKLTSIGDAETVEIEGFPFYWLPFMIEVIDRT